MTPHPAVAMPSAHRQRAMVLLAVCLAIGPLSALAQDAQLAPAPLRFEAQDAGAWADKSTPKSTKSRDEVVALYRTTYQPGDTVPLGWTGSVAQCDPGTSTLEHQQAVIARVSYFRALVGLPPVALLAGS